MKKSLYFIFVVSVFLIVSPAFSGNPHTICGKIFNQDGTVPANGAIAFKVYISNRPAEVLTEKSSGCGYQNGWFQIGIGNFLTSWSEGETLKIEFSTASVGETFILKQELNNTDPQIVKDITLE